MKKVTLIAATSCLILAGIFFTIKNRETSTPDQVVSEKKEETSQDESSDSNKNQSSASQDSPQKDVVQNKDDQDTSPKKSKSTHTKEYTKEEKIVLSTLLKRNSHFKNSDIEIMNIDNKTQRSSVVIRSQHKGAKYSFSALIDNKTGKVLRTWGRTIMERRNPLIIE